MIGRRSVGFIDNVEIFEVSTLPAIDAYGPFRAVKAVAELDRSDGMLLVANGYDFPRMSAVRSSLEFLRRKIGSN